MEYWKYICLFLATSMAVAVISLTVTKTKIFKGVRKWVREKIGPFLGDLFSCPFCFSFYVAALLDSYALVTIIPDEVCTYRFNVMISYLCMVGVSAIFIGAIFNSLKNIP